MSEPQCSSMSSVVEASFLMQVENSVSRKDPSNARRSILHSLQIRSCGLRCKSGMNFSSQNRNAATFLLLSSLFTVVSNLVISLEMDEWLPQERDFLRWSSMMWPMNFVGLWWYRTRLSWAHSSGGRESLCSLRIFQGLYKSTCSSRKGK